MKNPDQCLAETLQIAICNLHNPINFIHYQTSIIQIFQRKNSCQIYIMFKIYGLLSI